MADAWSADKFLAGPGGTPDDFAGLGVKPDGLLRPGQDELVMAFE